MSWGPIAFKLGTVANQPILRAKETAGVTGHSEIHFAGLFVARSVCKTIPSN